MMAMRVAMTTSLLAAVGVSAAVQSPPLGCDSVLVAYLGDFQLSCLHFPSRLPTPAAGNGSVFCLNTPDFSDGTNGCAAYDRTPDWCELYGHADYPGRGRPRDHCCVCGGGRPAR